MDKLVIFQDVGNLLIFCQTDKYIIFDLLQCLCSLSILLDDLLFLLLKFWHFLTDELVEHLFLETERCDGEVENGYLHRSLGRVVGVWKRCCHQELELGIVWNCLITKTERSTLVHLLEKNWLKCWVQLFANIFDKTPLTELNG